ncbi:DNA polymerase theta [Haematobia irritans]|uniref:DNA polymerase theta n=1 Tax=Haematobia irritans TaxID=7368 RepID=UPI003F4FA69C
MAFSQSFEFGNSTFMKLESEAKHAIQDNQENCDHNEKALEVIMESPKSHNRTSMLSASKSRSRVLHNTQRSNLKSNDTTHHRKFRRSKSDSTLPKPPKDISCDNYSEFFRSDFSLPKNDIKVSQRTEAKDEESFLRVSQIEAAFNGVDKMLEDTEQCKGHKSSESSGFEISEIDAAFNQLSPKHTSFKIDDDFELDDNEDDGEGSLDKPIFSEDLKDFIETEDCNGNENLLVNSLPLSNVVATEENHCVEPIEVMHEISSFLCHPQENPVKMEEKRAIVKELETSRMIFKESENPNVSIISENISLSHMSPDQLKFTQDSPQLHEKASTILKQKQEVTTHKKFSKEKGNDKNHLAIKSDVAENSRRLVTENIETLKSISAWNLPLSVLKEYERKGVVKMFDWQVECLSNPKVLFEHCNLVYSAPTSAGKTLVSEILLLKTVLERGKKVLLILPFISVVREKMFYLQDLLTAAGYRVEGFFGGYTPPGGFDSINVAICTIEKANSIINKLLEQGKLDEIGTIVVDEVHLISDPGRGYILELLLAKVLYMSRKYALQIQVITMSATLANVELLRNWLNAELFITNFRPVALNEMIKVGTKIYDNNLKVIRSITEPSVDIREPFPAIPNDADHIAQLCAETLIEGCSVIVFCPSKDWCENLSVQLAGAIHSLGKQGGEWGIKLRAQLNREAIDEVKQQLKDIPTGLDNVLEKTVTYGCAFHHAGLTTEERDIVEASFKSGALKIIVATSTLSSGVNLPARRVLIRSPLFGGKQMSSLTYKQMIGRAGRTGKDTLGESILICTENNARVGKELVTADLKPITSCLEMDSSTHLKRALLEVISSGVASTKTDIDNFVKCTLLSTQKQMVRQQQEGNQEDMQDECIGGALDFLLEYEFVRLQKSDETNEEYYVATRLGMACLASSMPPTDGLILFAELQKSRRCFVLESELHAVYLVTPYSVCYQLQDLDWLFFLDLWEKLTPAMKKVGELVGVKESFLVRAMRGQTKLDYKLMQIHKRFYTALALQELVNETPINSVAIKYKCSRGMLQSLQQMASTFAGIVTSFCNSLQWDTLSLIVSQFKERLYFGVHRDLIDLMRIPDLNHKRARALFDAGITSLVDLANADVLSIEKILYNSLSFDSAKQHDNENASEAAQRNEARNFYITGKAGITVGEAAKLLVQEARQFVQYEIGAGNIKWSQERNVENDIRGDKDEEELHMSYEEDKFVNGVSCKVNGKADEKVLKEKNECKMDPNHKVGTCVDDDEELHMSYEEGKFVNGVTSKVRKRSDKNVLKETNRCKIDAEVDNSSVPLKDNIEGKIKRSNSPNDNLSKNPIIRTEENYKTVADSHNTKKDYVNAKSKTKSPTVLEKDYKIDNGKNNLGTTENRSGSNTIAKRNSSEEQETNMGITPPKLIKENEKIIKHATSKSSNNEANGQPKSSPLKKDNIKPTSVTKSSPPKKDNIKPISITKNDNNLQAQKQNDIISLNEKRKSSEKPMENLDVTPPKLRLENKGDSKGDPKITDDDKPSTSKKAQRLLRAKQLSEMKKIEWAKKQGEVAKQNSPIKASDVQPPKLEYQIEKINSIEQENKQPAVVSNEKNNAKLSIIEEKIKGENKENRTIPKTKHDTPNTPRSSLINQAIDGKHTTETQKLPRRSPRNHLISSTRIDNSITSTTPRTKPSMSIKPKLKSPDTLFGEENEDSFVFNTGINEALKDAEKCQKPNLNQSPEDEIPSSQKLVEDLPGNKTNSPHASRFLRSLRGTQRFQSPKTITKRAGTPDLELKKSVKPPSTKKLEMPPMPPPSSPKEKPSSLNRKSTPPSPPPQEPPSSSSIEMSDFSMENSLLKNPMHLNASHILSASKVETDSSSFKSIDIMDICGDQQLFKGAFKEFMANKRLGICLGLQQMSGRRKPIIGANLLLNQVAAAEKNDEGPQSYEFQIDDSTYLAGIAFCISENLVYYMNMQDEGSCKGLTGEIKCKYLRMLFRSSEHCLIVYDSKEQLKILQRLLKDLGQLDISIEDPKVANWLLQPDTMQNLHSLAQQFAPECSALVNLCGSSARGYNSYGLDSDSSIFAKVRCSIESCVIVHILKGQIENLERIGTGQLYKFFKELEMPLQISLCNMEVIGFPASSDALHKLFQQMVDSMKKLEKKIYELHGSRFNLGSSQAVAKVLGLHRKSNGRVSTSKQILEKIDTPISQMIIVYRKLSVTLSKNIQPLLKCVRDERIHGQSITFTSTGRISMTEPNLQNVAKDFDVEIGSDKYTVSCRGAFYPIDAKRGLISSDFCQLEMRILAHLSQDSALLKVMRSEKDVFVAIAANWNKIPEESVSEQIRNGTKQICYGIVYGMGLRSLAEGLKCTEQEAKFVSEQFHAAYPGIRTYIEKVKKFARNNGYIETITGRRRYLEHINSSETSMKSQAERQAVNSTIQGSAADIAKSAILRMEKNITKYRSKLGIEPDAVRLVLHLHDELIFEVPEDKAKKIAKVLSITMENCVKLNVPLKVKLKIGKSWGDLKEVKI